MEALKKHPPALEAADHIVNNYSYGDFIPDDIVVELLQVDFTIDRNKSEKEIRQSIKDSQLYQMGATENMKSSLLKDHNYMLVRGKKGFHIVKPSEQTKIAMADLQAGLRKITRKAARRLLFIDREQLSVDQLRENNEAVAKMAQLKKAQEQSIGFTHKLTASS